MKKTVALFIAFLFIFSCFVYAEDIDNSSTNSDISFDILKKLGIIENIITEDKLNESITRRDFISASVKLLKLENGVSGEAAYYKDVEESDFAFAAIQNAARLGLISTEGNMFYPDNNITLEQAVKVLVCALGYEVMAEAEGGYPLGYIIQAKAINLLKNISLNENFTNINACKLLYNALTAKILVVTSLSSSFKTYNKDGSTLLYSTFGIRASQGIITGVGNSNLLSNQRKTPDNKIEIDSISYYFENADEYTQYIGFTVDYYINDDFELFYLNTNSNENKILEIKSERLVDADNSSYVLNYINEKDKPEKIKLPANAKILKNGKLESNLKTKNGYIKLIDNNKDGEYEVVAVWEFEDYVVDKSSKEKIYIKYSKELDAAGFIDVSEDNYNVKIQKDGEIIEPQALMEGDSISVAKDENNTLITIYATRNIIWGNITQINDSENKITIDYEDTFEKSSQLSKFEAISPPRVGDECLFYISAFDKIAAYEIKLNNGEKYGYLINIDNKGLGGLQFKIYDTEGKFKVYSSASTFRVSFDGEQYDKKSLEYVYSILYNKPQLVRYSVNTENEIAYLKTHIDNLKKPVDTSAFTLDYNVNTSTEWSDKDGNANVKNNLSFKYILTGTTTVFAIPDDITAEKSFQVGQNSLNVNCSGTKMLYAYDIDENKNIGAVVLELKTIANASSVSDTTGLFVVSKTFHALNEEGEGTFAIKGMLNGGETGSLFFSERASITNLDGKTISKESLKTGDVLQFALDLNGNISVVKFLGDKNFPANCEVIWEGATKRDLLSSANPDNYIANRPGYFAYGKVEFCRMGKLVLNVSATGNNPEYDKVFDLSSSNIYLYDSTNNTVKVVTSADILPGDRAIIRTRYLVTKDVVIFR